jgi:dTDP-4-amino-4,6-dideoxygalactose transaminase
LSIGRKWPKPNDLEESLLISVYRSGRWGRFDGAGFVEKFERDFALYHHARYGLAVINATMGLMLSYMALDIEPGDYFVVPAYTFIATATAGVVIGLKPVFVDIDFETLTLDTNHLAEILERDKDHRIKLVVPVHFAGNPADMDTINKLSKGHGAYVVEDAAQAHGSIYRNVRVGALGDMGIFSFQSSKLVTAGEGGIILTNNYDYYERILSIHHAGRALGGRWYLHQRIGLNMRMLEFQAAVLIPQLWRLDQTLAKLRESAKIVYEELSGEETLHVHRYPDYVGTNYYFIPISIDERYSSKLNKDKIAYKMREKGFSIVEGYHTPLYRQDAFGEKKWRLPYEEYRKLNLPNTEKACKLTMWIPHPEMLEAEDYIHKYIMSLKEVIRGLLS